MTKHKINILKALRDTFIATIAFALPQLAEALKLIDLGGYEHIVSVGLAALAFFLNRFFGLIHFNTKK
jgi:hypothetical protein